MSMSLISKTLQVLRSWRIINQLILRMPTLTFKYHKIIIKYQGLFTQAITKCLEMIKNLMKSL